MKFTTLCLTLASCAAFTIPAVGYGPAGHALVGAIADEKLAGTPAGARVTQLLDGLDLEYAANVPDRIKSWDRPNGHFNLPGQHPILQSQLREFFDANKDSVDHRQGEPLHHVFHYTDVPIDAASYAAATTGTSEFDVIHMIPYCVKVLTGATPENNERKITKSVAVILLAHYLGDIHQPLHVGAKYFQVGNQTLPDVGGNTITASFADGTTAKLHSYWDGTVVTAAERLFDEQLNNLRDPSIESYAAALKDRVPTGWQAPTGDPTTWAEAWANEILPIAREAHERLSFGPAQAGDFHGQTVANVTAQEKPVQGGDSYAAWSGKTAAAEIHKGGWRLAALLQAILH
jgi:hypothetical protein